MHLKKFIVLGITHKQYDLKKREEFIRKNPLEIIEQLYQEGKITGYIELSTCLRSEMYLELEEKFSLESLKKNFVNEDIFFKLGREGVKYFFEVICGFESVIKGEDQILSQIKKAFEISLEKKRTTTELNVIFNKGIELGKKFRNKSKICHNALSLEAISMKFIKKQVKDLKNKKVLLLGIGDLSVSIAKLLKKEGVIDITVTNRTQHKSLEIKEALDVKMIDFKDKLTAILESDVVISATSAPHYILKAEEIEEMLKKDKHTFLDLAVPRDIDEKLGDLPNVDLYNLDNLWKVHNENLGNRDNVLIEYSYLIDEQIELLNKWYKYKQGV
ncbi:MAG: glutamyl-tRNA reductase [Fusobacteriaceae bacterium]